MMIAVAAVAAMTLAGCGDGIPTSDGLYDEAKANNADFKSAVSAVQAQLDGGQWQVGEYGDGPRDCEQGYEFRMTRTSPESWSIETDALTAGKELGAWLGTNGWEDVQLKTFDGDVDDVVIQARNPEAGVARLDVDIMPGTVADGVLVRATSTCFDGAPNELMALMYPGWPTDTIDTETLPETESPDATPIFGFTADGTPRR